MSGYPKTSGRSESFAWRLRLGLAFSACVALLGCSAETQPQSPALKMAASPDQPDISGVWLVKNFSRSALTMDGEVPPLQPWAQELYAERRKAELEDNSSFPDTESYCLSSGVPRMMMGPSYPIQILQTPGQVTILFEALHNVRYIYLDQQHPDPEDLDPTFHGDSVGHWEGDTLVVDTIGLTDRTTIDKNGMPHSEELRVVEHIRRVDEQTLEVVMTLDDPKTFTAPWKYRAVYELQPPGTRLMEYFCENNRNLPDETGRVTFQLQN